MYLSKAQLYVLDALLVKHFYDNEWEPFAELWPAKPTTFNSLVNRKLIEFKTIVTTTTTWIGDGARTIETKATYAYRLTKAGRDLLDRRAEQRRAKETK